MNFTLTDQQAQAKQEALTQMLRGGFSTQGTGQPAAPIVGIGVGQDGIRVYVEGDSLPAGAVPDAFNGLQTNIIPTPGFTIGPAPALSLSATRPTPCGTSIGRTPAGTGTLGCLVQADQGTTYILSNNHVLADSNRARVGDLIMQPSRGDGGVIPGDIIAELMMWVPLGFTGAANYIDAALAKVLDPNLVLPDIQQIGRLSPGVATATAGLSVCKHGRTTGYTIGTIRAVSVDISVRTSQGMAWFKNQIEIDADPPPFSQPGDSGSLIVEQGNNVPVGLLFAGDGTRTLANPIDEVLTAFDVTPI